MSLDELNDLVALQFSGLLDKHGKEIYEGDIIQNVADNGVKLSKFIVSYSDCRFVKERIADTGVGKYDLEPSRFYEIIGDIYTTPELVDPKMIER